uniref:profilin-1-like isoform X2 n=1 Tax=Pristiophorus japonicus TaxID=55135 RepID=UPI00398EB9D8
MSSWQLYIDNMMATGNCGDVVFVGFEGTPSVWASVPDGNLSKITSDQIRCLVQTDGSGSFTNGVMLGTKKYMLVQDNWAEERYLCLIGKSETGEDLHAAVAKSNKVLVIAEGQVKVHSSVLFGIVFDITHHLVKNGF